MQQKENDFFLNDKSFEGTMLTKYLCEVIKKTGYSRPTPIQYYSIKQGINSDDNLICRSKSGTGKTLAYFSILLAYLCNLPILQNKTYAVIIVPTRQLAVQVYQNYKRLQQSVHNIKPNGQTEIKNRYNLKNCNALLTIGGINFEDDRKKYRQDPPKIVISTIGRLYQLTNQKVIKFATQKTILILDEGDKLFCNDDPKFMKIFTNLPSNIRWLVYSATYNKQILQKLYKMQQFRYIQTTFSHKNKLQITITYNPIDQLYSHKSDIQTKNSIINDQKQDDPYNSDINNLDNIHKFVYQVPLPSQQSLLHTKLKHLTQILTHLKYKKCLIFVTKKVFLEEISHFLENFDPLLIHGGMSQAQRFRVMNRLNQKEVKVIITSDLLARGIDTYIDLVVLFDVGDHATFWHRIGRTGRYGRTGVVVALDQAKNQQNQSKDSKFNWSEYDYQQINSILLGIIQNNNGQENLLQQDENNKVVHTNWYGAHLTQVGRWMDVDAEKQLQNNYRYFNPQQIADQSMRQQITVRATPKICTSSQKQKLNIPQFKSEQQLCKFLNQNIFRCLECIDLMQEVSQLTGYQFQIMKYYLSDRN